MALLNFLSFVYCNVIWISFHSVAFYKDGLNESQSKKRCTDLEIEEISPAKQSKGLLIGNLFIIKFCLPFFQIENYGLSIEKNKCPTYFLKSISVKVRWYDLNVSIET